MLRPNKPECLYLAITFQFSVTFAGNNRSLSRRKHLKGPPIVLARALPSNSKTWLERLSKDKPSNLFGLVVSDEEKKFYNIDARLKIWQGIRLGWKWLTVTNTLAYCFTELITAVKSLMIQAVSWYPMHAANHRQFKSYDLAQ